MTLATAARLLQIAAALLAVLIARRRRDHRPAAAFLVTMTLAGFVRWTLRTYVLLPTQQTLVAQGLDPFTVPLRGLTRLAGYADQALFLAWPAGLVALTLAVFPRRNPWPVAIPWALAVAVLVVGYDELRGVAARPVYLAAQLAAVLAAIGLLVQWGWRREPVTLPRMLTLFIIVLECGTLATAYRFGPFARWELAQVMYLVLYAVLVIIQGIAWTSLKQPKSRSD